MQKITPCLWFDKNAEEAANLYVSIFNSAPYSKGNSKIGKISRYGKEGFEIHKMPAGTVLTIEYELHGQNFMALNGGPIFKFSEAVSLVVDCETQEEVDYFWNAFTSQGGEESQCGWLKDRFGFSWQITPSILGKLLSDPDPVKAGRVMQAMLAMKKINIEDLQRASKGQ